MTYLVSIDPGMSTGIVLGWYDFEEAYRRVDYWQVTGGIKGFRTWWDSDVFHLRRDGFHVVYVCEKFVPLQNQRTFRVDELEPIRIEGALEILLGEEPIWQRSAAMVLAGGDTPAARKKASDDVLREAGLWLTGKQVGHKDANDVNAAQKHAIAYLRRTKHELTMLHYGWVE